MFIALLLQTEAEYEKEKLNERIARLSGGVAVIQVRDGLACSLLPLPAWRFSALELAGQPQALCPAKMSMQFVTPACALWEA